MSIDDAPVLGPVLEAGADDRVFDGLLLAGPILLCALALVGRREVTTVIAAGYIAVFVGYTLHKASGDESG
ncbi:hypothetical protein [Halopelagius longus]|uniref:Uncharacterized protein n=1 Tax=Halopelagius longus TaxID=1236180 RepID=A0A1H1E5N3_9EURY|nr:hypothetical protein [Halopelagius longus]RDI71609.1 hypothetical protein DWB78_07650 [Halopelagius longus]SDQ83798.1 hypothetical protein SAMN05216278_2737 [Halopelagius longus]